MADSESSISEAADAVEESSDTTALDVMARSGFAVMALLRMIVGAIAVAVAFGQPAANPWGPAVLWTCVVACTGLALWQLSEATLRARHLPRAKRVGKLISSGFLAVAYGSVGLSFAGFAVGMRGDRPEPGRAAVRHCRRDAEPRGIHRSGRKPDGAPRSPVRPVPARRDRGGFHLLRHFRAGPARFGRM